MRRTWLYLIAVLLGAPVSFAQPAPLSPVAEVIIHSIEAYGAVDIDFNPDDSVFAAYHKQIEARSGPDVQLYFSSDGKLIGCKAYHESVRKDFASALCAELMEHAKITIAPGYDIDGAVGFIGIQLGKLPAANLKLARPVILSETRDTWKVKVDIYRHFDTAKTNCSASVINRRSNFSAADYSAICRAFKTNRSAGRRYCKLKNGNADSLKLTYICQVRANRIAVSPFAEITAQISDLRSTDLANYRPARIDSRLRLNDDQGSLSVRLYYPQIALKNDWKGVTNVVLGISRDGKIQTCRPTPSKAHPYLNNATCVMLLERGRFRFKSDAFPYEGLKFRERTVRWYIPE